MKTASGAVLGIVFFAPGRFFVDFGVPLGSQTGHFGTTFGRLSRLFGELHHLRQLHTIATCQLCPKYVQIQISHCLAINAGLVRSALQLQGRRSRGAC